MSGLTGGALSKIYWESNTGGSSGNPVLQACLRGRRLALGCTPRPALCCRTPRSAVRSARGPPRRVGRRERLLTGSRGRGRSCRSWMSSASPRTMVRLAPADAQRCRAAWQRGRQPRAQNCPAVPGAANLRARGGGGRPAHRGKPAVALRRFCGKRSNLGVGGGGPCCVRDFDMSPAVQEAQLIATVSVCPTVKRTAKRCLPRSSTGWWQTRR